MEPDEAHRVIDYFLGADEAFLRGMGVDPAKLPTAERWQAILRADFERPIETRQLFYVLWEVDGVPIGHSHAADIRVGEEAYMHLHVWRPEHRRLGRGTHFVRESATIYFERLRLERLFCQPYALNPAPNRTLPAAGFELVETYETVPGWINFRQPVTKWVLTRERLESLMPRSPGPAGGRGAP
jgi:RimJ/RimL family protein N-acetyltransferase